MAMSTNRILSTLLGGTLAICSPTLAQQKPAALKTVSLNDKAYIALPQVQAIYQLPRCHQNGQQWTLESQQFKIDFTIGSQMARINGIRFFLSEPVRKHLDTAHIAELDLITLLQPAIRPESIDGAQAIHTVILDPGHGGRDHGSSEKESALTLAIAKATRKHLEAQGYQVILTREDNRTVSLAQRIAITKRTAKALVVSIHLNAAAPRVHGMETYIVSARTPHPAGAAGVALATAVHSRCLIHLNQVEPSFKLEDRGIRHAKFSLLTGSQHPTILIEAGYLTHPEQALQLGKASYQDQLGRAITRGIDVYNASFKKGVLRR